MVIFKPTAILVYFKKRKKALKIDLSYHIQQKKIRCQLFLLCWAENKSVSNFFGLKYLSTVGEQFLYISGGFWFGWLVFFLKKACKVVL